MGEWMNQYGIPLETVRATLSLQRWEPPHQPDILTVIVHPAYQDIIDRFSERVIAHASAVNLVNVQELPSGFILTVTQDSDRMAWGQGLHHMPWAISVNTMQTQFSCCDDQLNEFGLIYVALHICGNFARYYPDLWLAHIDRSSQLALTINQLLEVAFERVPLNALSELSRTCFVQKA